MAVADDREQALVVAGCSTGQAAPSGSLVRLSLTNAAATGTGTLTGDVCKPLQAPPQAKVTVSLRESVPGVGWGPQIRSETVRENAGSRFRSVLAGIYVLVGQWPASPLFTRRMGLCSPNQRREPRDVHSDHWG